MRSQYAQHIGQIKSRTDGVLVSKTEDRGPWRVQIIDIYLHILVRRFFVNEPIKDMEGDQHIFQKYNNQANLLKHMHMLVTSKRAYRIPTSPSPQRAPSCSKAQRKR